MSLTKHILEWCARRDKRNQQEYKSGILSREWYQRIINEYKDKLREYDEEITRRANANKST